MVREADLMGATRIVGCYHAMEMTPEQWRKTLDVNTTGSFLCAQAVAKQFSTQKTGGSITLTASISAVSRNPFCPSKMRNMG